MRVAVKTQVITWPLDRDGTSPSSASRTISNRSEIHRCRPGFGNRTDGETCFNSRSIGSVLNWLRVSPKSRRRQFTRIASRGDCPVDGDVVVAEHCTITRISQRCPNKNGRTRARVRCHQHRTCSQAGVGGTWAGNPRVARLLAVFGSLVRTLPEGAAE
jgi:hypothetical protein